jgi:hypothetical protein
MTESNSDAFALGDRQDVDPIIALVDEYFRLMDEGDAVAPDGDTGAAVFFDQVRAILKRIVDMRATSLPGVCAQLRLLAEIVDIGDGEWTDDRDGRFYRSLLSGAARLAAVPAP